MQHIVILIFTSVFMLTSTISIGRVSNARLLPGLKNQTFWLMNQENANACLCSALQLYSLEKIAALNSFSSNSTCQLILSPPVLSPNIVFDIKSNLVLLQPLTNAPCCSDLSWLLTRIKNSQQQSSDSVQNPTVLSMNSDNTLISTLSYYGSLFRFHRTNFSLEGIYSLPPNYSCALATYRRGQFYMGMSFSFPLSINTPNSRN